MSWYGTCNVLSEEDGLRHLEIKGYAMLISKYLDLVNKIQANAIAYKRKLRLEVNDPGYILQLRKNNQLVHEDCFGVKDQKTKAPINSKTNFLMASLAKPVVANIILDNLDHFPEKYVNEYIYSPHNKLTLSDLIRHRSGLSDYLSFLNKKTINEISLDDLVKSIFLQDLKFNCGQQSEYSNSGYIILTKIIETVFQGDYCQVVKEKYLEKNIDFNFLNQKSYASNYYKKGDVYKKIPHTRYITGWGDGLLYANASEYTKIFSGPLKYKQLLHPGRSCCGEFYYHIGGVPGVDTLIGYLAEMDLEIILICNSSNDNLRLSDLILDSIEGKDNQQLSEIQI